MSIHALPAVLLARLASVITALLGAKATHRMKTGVLRKLFALLLLVLATKLLPKVFARPKYKSTPTKAKTAHRYDWQAA